jgi:hypothetical protein
VRELLREHPFKNDEKAATVAYIMGLKKSPYSFSSAVMGWYTSMLGWKVLKVSFLVAFTPIRLLLSCDIIQIFSRYSEYLQFLAFSLAIVELLVSFLDYEFPKQS